MTNKAVSVIFTGGMFLNSKRTEGPLCVKLSPQPKQRRSSLNSRRVARVPLPLGCTNTGDSCMRSGVTERPRAGSLLLCDWRARTDVHARMVY